MALLRIISVWIGLAIAVVDGQGTCTFDTKCFIPRPGCSLIKETPFWRLTPSSCEECLALCQEKLTKPIGPFCCQSVVYDAVTRTCDIFAVTSRGPANTGSWQGRIYFQPTGAPGCAANNTPPATAPLCKSGETAKLIAVKDYSVDGLTGKDAPNLDANGCGKACLDGKLPDGTAITCKAALFNNGKCTLSTDAPKSEADQKKTDGATFFRVYCFPNDLVKNCPDTFIEAPQKILVGQNKLTVDQTTLDGCIKACLNSQKDNGFVCKSAIYYYNDQRLNCILNVESNKTKPDLFTEAASDDKEVYFETDCGGGQRFHDVPKTRSKAFKDALNDIPEHGDWTLWSPCHGRNSEQYRWERCRSKKPLTECKRQSRSCDPSKSTVTDDGAGAKKPGDEKLLGGRRKMARDQVTHH